MDIDITVKRDLDGGFSVFINGHFYNGPHQSHVGADLECDLLRKEPNLYGLVKWESAYPRSGVNYDSLLESLQPSLTNDSLQQVVMRQLIRERRRQDAKWGEQNHDDKTWLAIATEELGEVANAILEDEVASIEFELKQLTAVCVAWLESKERAEFTEELAKLKSDAIE